MRKNGFTLIELLVVVGIIVILIAILVPAIGKAKDMARRAQTESLLTHLSTTIETYYATFHAYPGPSGPDGTTAASNKISGAQNMLLGLSYAMVQTNLATGQPLPSPPFASGWRVNPNTPGSVSNFATIGPTGNAEQLSSFFDVSPQQISSPVSGQFQANAVWNATGIATTGATAGTGNAFKFPVVVDTFPDALPVLYYRRTPGVDGPQPSVGHVVSQSAYNAAQPYAYHWLDNAEYTTASITAASGRVCPQTNIGGATKFGALSNANDGQKELESIIMGGPSNAPSARGGFILISAGSDRIYGKVISNNGPAIFSDDIIRVGGN
jgi:prepilin-type N-terminal cleavage/methylation domain-containing protein